MRCGYLNSTLNPILYPLCNRWNFSPHNVVPEVSGISLIFWLSVLCCLVLVTTFFATICCLWDIIVPQRCLWGNIVTILFLGYHSVILSHPVTECICRPGSSPLAGTSRSLSNECCGCREKTRSGLCSRTNEYNLNLSQVNIKQPKKMNRTTI